MSDVDQLPPDLPVPTDDGAADGLEAARRLELPYPLASDPLLAVADELGLPTFEAEGVGRLYRRLTFVAREGVIERVFYPVFPPDRNAEEVVAWLTRQR